MDQGMLGKVAALRDEAFATFRALDDAVATLGGERRVARPNHSAVADAVIARRKDNGGIMESIRRVSQAAAAEMILRELNVPTAGADLMEALPSKGVTIGGANPIVNFTSSMSKSGKFRSVRRGGSYFWWFKDEVLPPGWNDEAPNLLSKEGFDAPFNGNQEGGDEHAATITTS